MATFAAVAVKLLRARFCAVAQRGLSARPAALAWVAAPFGTQSCPV